MSPMIVNSRKSDTSGCRRGDPDLHVGARIRVRRTMLGMTQEQLGALLGISFQQVQKYERGQNRVVASRLFQIARLLDAPVSFFFDDLNEETAPREADRRRGAAPAGSVAAWPDDDVQAIRRLETVELVRAYYRITDANARRSLLRLVKSVAGMAD